MVRSRSPPSRRASTCARGHWRGRRERCHRCKTRVVGWLPDHARRAARFTSPCQARASAPVANARRAAYAANATPTAADRLGEVQSYVSAAPGRGRLTRPCRPLHPRRLRPTQPESSPRFQRQNTQRRTVMTQKPVKPAKSTDRPVSPRPPRTRRRKPSHGEISERAYFIQPPRRWIRSARELAAGRARASGGLTTQPAPPLISASARDRGACGHPAPASTPLSCGDEHLDPRR